MLVQDEKSVPIKIYASAKNSKFYLVGTFIIRINLKSKTETPGIAFTVFSTSKSYCIFILFAIYLSERQKDNQILEYGKSTRD
jgi:hypothetical protein